MVVTLVLKLLRDVRWTLPIVCLILFLFSLLWVKIAQRVTTEIYPFFNGLAVARNIDPKVFDEVLFKGPGKVSQAVMGGADIRFDQASDFLAVELLHPVVLALSCLWAVGRAAGAIAGELDRGTMELLLSQPVPRNRLIIAHLIVDAFCIPTLCASIVVGTQTGLAVMGPFKVDYTVLEKLEGRTPPKFRPPKGPDVLPVDATQQWRGAVNLAGLIFAMSGITMAISSINRNRWKAMGFAALVVVGMFVANVVGQLWDGASFVRPFSIFFYYQPQKLWLKGESSADFGEAWHGGQPLLGVPVIPFLFALGTLGYGVALRVFTKRDLPAPL